jgi:hypothetical protein
VRFFGTPRGLGLATASQQDVRSAATALRRIAKPTSPTANRDSVVGSGTASNVKVCWPTANQPGAKGASDTSEVTRPLPRNSRFTQFNMSQPRPGSERLRCSLERTLETKRCHGGLCGARNGQRGEEANRDITAGRDSLYVVLMSLFILKSVIEERFLRDNPEYAAYMRQVRYRWIQGVA